MSKSKGNIIDPIDLIDGINLEDLIEKRATDLMQPDMAKKIESNTKKDYPNGINSYGTDALRFTFAALASNGRDINFDLKRVEGYKNFCNKIWNAARFVKIQNFNMSSKLDLDKLNDEDLWIRNKIGHLIENIRSSYKNYRFDYAAKDIYSFVWQDYCSWYIEISKANINNKKISSEQKELIVLNLRDILKNILLCLHPIMPFITEEIYSDVFNENKFLQENSFPDSSQFTNSKDINNINWMIQVVSDIRKTRSEIGVQPNKTIEIYVTGATNKDKDYFEKMSNLIMNLGKIKEINLDKEIETDNFYACVSNNLKLLIPSSGIIDAELEIERLSKDESKYLKQLESIETRLSNKDFISNAPGHIVVADEQKLRELKIKLDKIQEQLKSFS